MSFAEIKWGSFGKSFLCTLPKKLLRNPKSWSSSIPHSLNSETWTTKESFFSPEFSLNCTYLHFLILIIGMSEIDVKAQNSLRISIRTTNLEYIISSIIQKGKRTKLQWNMVGSQIQSNLCISTSEKWSLRHPHAHTAARIENIFAFGSRQMIQ